MSVDWTARPLCEELHYTPLRAVVVSVVSGEGVIVTSYHGCLTRENETKKKKNGR